MPPLPRFYAILDAGLLQQRGIALPAFAEELRAAGVQLLQYRDKQGSPRQILENVAFLKSIFAGPGARLILNDHADLAFTAELDGVHLGQQDLSPLIARRLCGSSLIIGLSTHNAEQLIAGDTTAADYLAIGPIFSTSTKVNPDPVVGLEGLRALRKLTGKPLVAIGGITRANARSVIDAGADSVAVISDLLPHRSSDSGPESWVESGTGLARKSAEDFQALLL